MTIPIVRRFVGDVLAVLRRSEPRSAARWLAALIIHLPQCLRLRSLQPADRAWERSGARFRTSSGAVVTLPGPYTAGAREMYCRNVYLRASLHMPRSGWVIDLGANSGLFSVWAACTGANVLAVEAQEGFGPEISRLAAHNGVGDRVRVETASAGGTAAVSGRMVGALADDDVWKAASHAAPTRSGHISMPALLAKHRVERVALLKMDIEGGEFAVLGEHEDLGWLEQVDQVVLEMHPAFGDRGRSSTGSLPTASVLEVTTTTGSR